MFSNLRDNRLLLEELKKIGTYKELQKLDYVPYCISCPQNYIRKEDNKCYLCNLNDCSSCSYGNSTYYDIATIGINQAPHLFHNLANVNFQLICSSCGSSSIATIASNMTECKKCTSLISNCESCSYGGYNISSNEFVVFDSSTYWQTSLKTDTYKNVAVTCKVCASGYGLGDMAGSSCSNCPSNCDYCYYYKTGVICGRCKSNYVLKYDDGGCIALASVTGIPDIYKSECSRIINKNPLQSYIQFSSNFLCQICSSSNKAPIINGYCTEENACATSFNFKQKVGGFDNITDILYYKPHYLENLITSGMTDLNYLTKCSECPSDYALSGTYECCIAVNIEKCISCLSCQTASCQVCKTCVSNDPVDDSVESTDDFSYAKQIYLKLSSISSITPKMTNNSYTALFDQLTTFQFLELDSINLKSCYPCPILTKNCQKLSGFSATSYWNDYFGNSVDNNALKLLIYRLLPTECQSGFIYDSYLKRCVFCPDGWESCASYKEIEINFIESSQKRTLETEVQTFSDLLTLLTKIDKDLEFNYICNEFAVQNLTYFINFPDGIELTTETPDFIFSFSTTISNRVPSLKNVSIVFQSSSYKTDPLKKGKVFLMKRLLFENFDTVTIRNIDFKVVGLVVPASFDSNMDSFLKTVPGFTFKKQSFRFYLCSFSTNREKTMNLFEGVIYGEKEIKRIESPFADQPLDLFIVYSQNNEKNVIKMYKIEISLTFNLTLSNVENSQVLANFVKQLYFFYLLSSDVTLSDLNIYSMTLVDICLFYFGSAGNNQISIKNIILSKCHFENLILFVGNPYNSINLDVVSIKDSVILYSTMFEIDQSSSCYMSNILVEKNVLTSSSSKIAKLFSVRLFYFKNLKIISNAISNYLLASPDGSSSELGLNLFSLLDVYVYGNTFSLKENSQLFLNILYPSTTSVSSMLKMENCSFLKNNFIASSSVETPFFINIRCLTQILFMNVSIFDNEGFSFIQLDTITMVKIETTKIRMDNVVTLKDESFFQILNLGTSAEFRSVFIWNVKTLNNIISVLNSVFSKTKKEDILIIFSNFTFNNIALTSSFESIVAPLNIYLKNSFVVIMDQFNASDVFLTDKSELDGSSSIIYVNSLNATINIDNMVVKNASTDGKTNAFTIIASELNIFRSNFSDANLDKRFENLNGGLFNVKVESATIKDCFFLNSVAIYGGAAYITLKKEGKLLITETRFEKVSGSNQGGVLFLDTEESSGKSNITIDFVEFMFCSGDKLGGILYSKQKAININTVVFKNCNFLHADSPVASILYSTYSEIYFTSCLFLYDQDWRNSSFFEFKNIDTGSLISGLFSNLVVNSSVFKFLKNGISGANLMDLEGKSLSIVNCTFFDFYFSNPGFLLESLDLFVFDSIFYDLSFFSSDNSVSNQGLFYIKKTNAIFENCTVENVIPMDYYLIAGFIKLENSNLNVTNCTIKNVSGLEGGFINGLSSKIWIFNSSFSYISANLNGGVLSSDDSLIYINGSNFSHCNAEKKGGVIYSYLPDILNRSFVINSKFFNNSAEIGGAIYYQTRILEIDRPSVIFLENKAKYYGQSVYSYPRMLKLVEDNNDLNSSLSTFRSGDKISNITFFLLDEEYNIIKSPTLFSVLSLYLTPYLAYKDNIAGLDNKLEHIFYYSTEDYSYKIRDKYLYGVRGSKMSATFSHPDIRIPKIDSNELELIKNLTMTISFRECKIGELDKVNSTLVCDVCQNTFYSFSTSDLICKDCLNGLICNETGITYIKKGYWRDDIYSEAIVGCDDSPSDCIGGLMHSNMLCSEGHVGAKCGSCDLMAKYWSKNYARSSGSTCIDCTSVKWNYVILAFISVWSFISMFLSVKGTMATVRSLLQSKVLKVLAKYSMIEEGESMSSIYIKIYLSYYQIIQVINTFDLTVPGWMETAPETVGNPVSSALYSFDCLIPKIKFDFSYLYFKTIFTLLIPIFYLIVFGGSYSLYITIFNLRSHFVYLYTVCLFTLVNFQTDIVQSLIQVLSCVRIGGKDYIKADYNFLCYTSEFWFFTLVLAIPALIFWAFLCPGGILIYLTMNRNQLNETKNIIRLGYIYQEYNIFFWEFVKMYQKISIMFFLEFYDADVTIKGLLILVVLTLYYAMLAKFNPYASIYLNRLEKLTTLILFFSIIFALIAYKNIYTYLLTICYIVIGIINVVYNAVMLYFIIFSLFAENNEKLKMVILKLSRFFGFSNFFNIKESNPLAIQRWKTAKRLVSKYLRERIRRKNEKNIELKIRGNSIYNLSMEDYDPECVGVKYESKKPKKMSFSFDEENLSIQEFGPEKLLKQKNNGGLGEDVEEIEHLETKEKHFDGINRVMIFKK